MMECDNMDYDCADASGVNEKRTTDPKALCATLTALHSAGEVNRVNLDVVVKGMKTLRNAQVLALDGKKDEALLLLAQVENVVLIKAPEKKSVSQKKKNIDDANMAAGEILENYVEKSNIDPIMPDWTEPIGGEGEGVQRQLYALKGGSEAIRLGCFLYYIADPYTFNKVDVEAAEHAGRECASVEYLGGVRHIGYTELEDSLVAFGDVLLRAEYDGLPTPVFTEGDLLEPPQDTPWDEAVNDFVEPIRSVLMTAKGLFELHEEDDQVTLGNVAYRVAKRLNDFVIDMRDCNPPI